MDDLVRFLRARYDEDAEVAQAATWCDDAGTWRAAVSEYGTPARPDGPRWYVEDALEDGVVTTVDPQASADEGVARHIARHDPARVLAEVEMKRQIADEHVTRDWKLGERLHDCQWTKWPCRTLRLLALPYADHPDYQEAWRP